MTVNEKKVKIIFLVRDLIFNAGILLALALGGCCAFLLWQTGIVPGLVFLAVIALVARYFYWALTQSLVVDRPEDSGKITAAEECSEEAVQKCAAAVEFLRVQSGWKVLPTFYMFKAFPLLPSGAAGGKVFGKMFGYVMLEERAALELETEELAGMLAHEMTHFESCDSLKGIVFNVISFAALLSLPLVFLAGFLAGAAPGLGVLSLMLLTGVTAAALKNLWVYFAEYAADAGSAHLTGSPEYFRSGLDKLSHFELQPEIQAKFDNLQREIESGRKSRSFALLAVVFLIVLVNVVVPVAMFLMGNFAHPAAEKRYRALEGLGR